eukprot:6478724-Amphidinium_carterae.1
MKRSTAASSRKKSKWGKQSSWDAPTPEKKKESDASSEEDSNVCPWERSSKKRKRGRCSEVSQPLKTGVEDTDDETSSEGEAD